MALDQARARAGAERLADVDGVIGTLLDVVQIDHGWEAAFEAAAGEAIAAVVVADVVDGRAVPWTRCTRRRRPERCCRWRRLARGAARSPRPRRRCALGCEATC